MLRAPHAGTTQSGGFRLNVLTQEELREIHLATLEVLEHTGVYVQCPKAREVLFNGGARVDEKTHVVKFPPRLVEEAISSAPSTLVLRARDPKKDFVMGSNRVAFTNFGEAVNINDIYTGEYRESVKQDLEMIGRVVDYLDPISVFEKPAASSDKPVDVIPMHNFEAMINNCTKHLFMGSMSGEMTERICELSDAVVRECFPHIEDPSTYRLVSFITCPVSPLRLVTDSCEIIMAAARNNAVINILSMAMAGGSTSIHLAGTLVSHNAEVLSGIILAQLTKKGAPVVYGSSTTALDLKTASAVVGSPELGMISAGVAALANYYGLPSWVAGG